tara:strand:- start:3143 stop:3385 length:243 start_codon:yes stop_codon:yes gene_type:complete
MEAKIIKVTDEGGISLPVGIREDLEIGRGDELIVSGNGDSIILRKIKTDDFSDLLKLSELSLRDVWVNEEDEIWNSYLKE